jgi:hypothetical protein
MFRGPASFWRFVRAFWSNWWSGMSGAFSVPLALYATYVEDQHAKLGYAALAALVFVMAAFFVWRAEKLKVLEMEHRLSPNTRVFVEPVNHGVRELLTDTLGEMPKQKWVQLSVQNLSENALLGCEAFLTRVARQTDISNPNIIDVFTQLCWDLSTTDQLDIPHGRTVNVHLFSMQSGTPGLHVHTAFPTKYRYHTEIQTPDRYRLDVIVTSRNAPTVRRSFILDWQDYDNVKLIEAIPSPPTPGSA